MVKEEIKYKETGIEWVPTIPSHWTMRRIKTLFTFRKEIVGEDSSQYKVLSLTVQGDGIIERDIESGMGKFPATFDGYQKIEPNSIVLCLFDMDVTPRIVGFSELTGMISAAYTNIVPKENVYPKFYYYYFLNQDRDKSLYALGKGIRITLREDSFGSLFAPYPSYEEQKAIVEYLDAQIEKINLFIHKKQRFIELLKEQRQTIITNAITKGVDVNTKSKNSRVEWLGDVPAHWRIIRLKFLGESFIGLTYSPVELVDKEDGIFVLRSSNIQNGKFTTEDNVYVNKEIPEKLILKKGDILLCSRNGSAELIGKNILIDEESAGNTFGAFMTVFRSNLNYYLYYFFNSNVFKSQTSLFATSTINQLTNSILSNLTIAYPESFDEQMRIIEHIKTETATIDTAIAKAEREIELIREYKEAMIAEAVMGKSRI